MKKYTYYLFALSLVFSFLSFFTIKAGYGEIYPFYTWRLFTKPSGSSTTDFQYKLYGISKKDTVRLTNTDSALFDGNEKASIINNIGSEIDKNKTDHRSKGKLYRFAKVIEPGYQSYLLIKESFNAQKIDKKDFKINREIITELK
ncbi:hypothetical protein QGN23_14730 [Chryseobacterium gotjawalense]|uniref:Uncharacterized protein n=1 Tax=Chryseobacterium gotjawalense TaxID=3042315 RepID=A0ABY8RCH0_9FLAO|nr:hypothetical protein [Chryseobacterium sp. wdc7]WHF51658.1 hypothetical protein QGN23_14730 [Chryseobacterium sp. wdc7]